MSGSGCTVWDWNSNYVQSVVSPAGTQSYFYSNSVSYPNGSLFTAAAEQFAAPTGPGPPLAYGYGGTVGGGPSGGYGRSGAATGLDPVASYSSQVGHVAVTRIGQRIWTADRYDDSGSSNSTLVWLTMSCDAYNQPTVVWTSSFTPSA